MPRNTRQNAKWHLGVSEREVQQAHHPSVTSEAEQSEHSSEALQAQHSSEAQQAQHSAIEQAQHPGSDSSQVPQAQLRCTVASLSDAQPAKHLGACSEVHEAPSQTQSKRLGSRNTRLNTKLRLDACETEVKQAQHMPGTVSTSKSQQALKSQRSKRLRSSFTSVKQQKALRSGNSKAKGYTQLPALETKRPRTFCFGAILSRSSESSLSVYYIGSCRKEEKGGG
ncbi:hypothetical protein EDC01DRAFT_636466 [Geopyxis carbonaria]|nr:hypothetical protein EDC01DRAFT_636466 [Geopyxis carbonaria]